MSSLQALQTGDLPQLWDAAQLGAWGGWPAKQSYEVAPQLPRGCVIRFGRRLRFRVDLLRGWLESQKGDSE